MSGCCEVLHAGEDSGEGTSVFSWPGQVGRETLREHSTHNQREEDQSGMRNSGIRRKRVRGGFEGEMRLEVRPWGGA